MHRITMVSTLENESGVMATQTNVWENLSYADVCWLEGMFAMFMKGLADASAEKGVSAVKAKR